MNKWKCGKDCTTDRVAAAYRVANKILGFRSEACVMLVGSTARGLATSNSDVDLAVLVDDEVVCDLPAAGLDNEAFEICVEQYVLSHFEAMANQRFLDQKQLCESARIAQGMVLTPRTPTMQALQRRLATALLHPKLAIFLLANARLAVEAGNRSRSGMDRLRYLQGAALSLAQLRVCFTPWRYQKPKWLMHDLVGSGDARLTRVVRDTLVASEYVSDTCERVRQALSEAMATARRPFLVRSPHESFEDCYLRQTLRDAEDLRDCGDIEGASLTAIVCLRLAATHLQSRFEDQRQGMLSDGHVQDWEQECLTSLFPHYCSHPQDLLPLAKNLSALAGRLSKICARAYQTLP